MHRRTILTSLAIAGILYLTPERAWAQQGDRALLFCGDGGAAICGEGTKQLSTALLAAGAAGVDQNPLLGNLTSYRLIFVVVPMAGMAPENVQALTDFYKAGGFVVGVSESSGYGTGYASPSLNVLTNSLGFGNMFNNTNIDSGCTKSGVPNQGHALMSAVTAFDYAWSCSVTGGVPLVRGQAGQALVNVRERFVACADGNIFTDNCGLNVHAPSGNIQFFKNLWTWSGSTADADGDGLIDAVDNCPMIANPMQENLDGDALGDLCDLNSDSDAIVDTMDNCPLVSNQDQLDTDADGMGNACDGDDDGDTALDGMDNCPLTANSDQLDTDKDAKGDACDTDDDQDGIADTADNCPLVVNPNQLNTDKDTVGDACDPDDDNDMRNDGTDNCPLKVNPDQKDTDADGQGDDCESDDDDDGVADLMDNCPLLANADQTDTNSDSEGDACDIDDDADKIIDGMDNCPLVKNSVQADQDGDGVGDACDPDIDADGTPNGDDPCPANPNADCRSGGDVGNGGNGGAGGNGSSSSEDGGGAALQEPMDEASGCSCRVGSQESSSTAGAGLLMALGAWAYARRHARRTAS